MAYGTAVAVLRLMAMLGHTDHPEVWNERADAIVAATNNPFEQRLLITIDFKETRFGIDRGPPFGVTSVHRDSIAAYAVASIAIMHNAAVNCHVHVGDRPTWLFYLTGHCQARRFIHRHHRRIHNPAQRYADESMHLLARLGRLSGIRD
jgi:hypothetical protein